MDIMEVNGRFFITDKSIRGADALFEFAPPDGFETYGEAIGWVDQNVEGGADVLDSY
ncbi:MAG: hypothetical protein ACRD3D_01130 [Terriglobia bacterium]